MLRVRKITGQLRRWLGRLRSKLRTKRVKKAKQVNKAQKIEREAKIAVEKKTATRKADEIAATKALKQAAHCSRLISACSRSMPCGRLRRPSGR